MLPFFGQILDRLGDLDTIESSGPKFFVFDQKIFIDTLQLANVLRELADHLIGSAELFGQFTLLCTLTVFLPSGEGPENSSKIVIIYFSKCESLTLDEMLQQIISLYVEMIDCLVHSLDSALRGADKVFVGHNLINELLLRQFVQNLLRIRFLVLPFLEIDREWMVKTIQNEPSIFFDSLSGFDPFFPLIQGLRDDVEVGVLEEKSNDSFLHISSLHLRLLSEELIDLLRRISRGYKLISQSLGVSLGLVSLQNYISFSVDDVSEIDPITIMSPFVEEVLDSVLSHMLKASLQEPLFKIFILTSIFEVVECPLNSSLEKSIKNLCKASGSVCLRLMLSLVN